MPAVEGTHDLSCARHPHCPRSDCVPARPRARRRACGIRPRGAGRPATTDVPRTDRLVTDHHLSRPTGGGVAVDSGARQSESRRTAWHGVVAVVRHRRHRRRHARVAVDLADPDPERTERADRPATCRCHRQRRRRRHHVARLSDRSGNLPIRARQCIHPLRCGGVVHRARIHSADRRAIPAADSSAIDPRHSRRREAGRGRSGRGPRRGCRRALRNRVGAGDHRRASPLGSHTAHGSRAARTSDRHRLVGAGGAVVAQRPAGLGVSRRRGPRRSARRPGAHADQQSRLDRREFVGGRRPPLRRPAARAGRADPRRSRHR